MPLNSRRRFAIGTFEGNADGAFFGGIISEYGSFAGENASHSLQILHKKKN